MNALIWSRKLLIGQTFTSTNRIRGWCPYLVTKCSDWPESNITSLHPWTLIGSRVLCKRRRCSGLFTRNIVNLVWALPWNRGTQRRNSACRLVRCALHDYRSHVGLNKMRCYCRKSLVLIMSQPEMNPDCLYFKSCKRIYDFFEWGDEPPRGQIRDHLEPGSHTHLSLDAEGHHLQGGTMKW